MLSIVKNQADQLKKKLSSKNRDAERLTTNYHMRVILLYLFKWVRCGSHQNTISVPLFPSLCLLVDNAGSTRDDVQHQSIRWMLTMLKRTSTVDGLG